MALTTTAIVKEEIGTPSGDTSKDALIARHITAVEVAFRNIVGRPIEQESVVEWLDGPGVPELVLRYYPIIGNPTITEDGVAVDVADLLIRADRGIVVRFPSDEPDDWSKGVLNIKAEYEAGLGAVGSAPEDIQNAAKEQVIYQLRRTAPYGGRVGERSSTLSENATTVWMIDALLPSVREVLALYRQPRGGG